MKKINLILTLMFAFTVLFTQAQDFIQDFESPNVLSEFTSNLININCPTDPTNDPDCYWVGDHNNCNHFTNDPSPDGGNFMTVNINDNNTIPGGIYFQNVNNISGNYCFSIDLAHRYNIGQSTAPDVAPVPVTLEFRAYFGSNFTSLATFIIQLGSNNWTTFTQNVNIPVGTHTIVIVQNDFGRNGDYSIDRIELSKNILDFHFEDSNGTYSTNFCNDQAVFLDARASDPVDRYFIAVWREDLTTGATLWSDQNWIDEDLDLFNLTNYLDGIGFALPGEYLYHVKIGIMACGEWKELTKSFTVCDCTVQPKYNSTGSITENVNKKFNNVTGPTADFALTGSAGAWLQAIAYMNYENIGGYTHFWYIFTSNNINGPYTSYKKINFDYNFTLQNLDANKIYTVVHKVVGPCYSRCSAQYLDTNGQTGTPNNISACNLANQWVNPNPPSGGGCPGRVASLDDIDKEIKGELSKMIQNDLNNNYFKVQKAYIKHEKEIARLLNSENIRLNKLYVECKKAFRKLLRNAFALGSDNSIQKEDYVLFNQFLNELKGGTASKALSKEIEQVQKYLPVMLGKDALTAIRDFDQATELEVSKTANPALANITQTHLLNNLADLTTLQFESTNQEGSLLIQLYDFNGNLIKTIADNVQLENGNFKATIDKSNLSQGIHLIEVQYTNQQGTYQEMLKLPVFK